MSINGLHFGAAATHPITADTSAIEAAQTLLSMALAAFPGKEEGGQTTLNPKKRRAPVVESKQSEIKVEKKKPRKRNSWEEYEIDILNEANSPREAIAILGTKRHTTESIRCKWEEIVPKDKKRVINSWEEYEIDILKEAKSSKEAVRALGTTRHNIKSIQYRWEQIALKDKKQIHNSWTDREIEVIKNTASTKEAIRALGTTRHTVRSIQAKWNKIAAARRHSLA